MDVGGFFDATFKPFMFFVQYNNVCVLKRVLSGIEMRINGRHHLPKAYDAAIKKIFKCLLSHDNSSLAQITEPKKTTWPFEASWM